MSEQKKSFQSFVCGLMFDHKDQIKAQDELCTYLNQLNYSDFTKIFELILHAKNCVGEINVFTDIGETFVSLIYNPETIVLGLDNIECIKLVLNNHNDLDMYAIQEWVDENKDEYPDKASILIEYIEKNKQIDDNQE